MPKSFEVDIRELKKFERDLRIFSDVSFDHARQQSINDTAFFAMRQTKKNILREFITRNKWTASGVKVEKSKNLKNPMAIMGTERKYMFDQEFGATRTAKGKHNGVAIPTRAASGEGRGRGIRRKVVKAKNRLSRIRVSSRKGGGSVIGKIRDAKAAGAKVIFLKLRSGKKGLYRLSGSKKKPNIALIYDLSRPSVPVPKTPTILPATNKADRRMEQFYFERIKFQLRRRGMFID